MKRHLLTIGGGLAGIVLTVLLLMTGVSAIQGRQSTATPDLTLETPDMADVPDLGGDGMTAAETRVGEPASVDPVPIDPAISDPAIGDPSPVDPASTLSLDNGLPQTEDKAVRDIAPEHFGLPREVTAQPLERIAPRTPLSQALARPEPVPSVLRHPVALSAGLIQFGDQLLQLDGIVPEKADRVCGEAGKTWPCGVVARTAFRNFLRARALLCMVPKNGWQGTLTAACSVNNIDPAVWLAENGWANVPAGSPLAGKVEAARQSRLGFFGDDPRDFSTAPAPLDEPALPGGTDTGVDRTDQGL
ncbi:thermonuclease family protein [Pararhizobium sp. YC-54]|uniref:thermonuclease family protein n=1 Tax=Pararhizobium sp. YC-54 TaxID=2986920 RepID=UPI0021F7F019|nr:thermonuclease family protein [Pararhizobium sp. YC-54]MCV9998932.1 thermonuclease family protein [Pararhizobium sp. YC-54]